MMNVDHELKIQKPFADAIVSNRKTFEVRKNDRGFNFGDTVRFRCIEDTGLTYRSIEHAINYNTYRITYVLSGWGISEGYVIFSIELLERVIPKGIEVPE